MRFLKTSFLLFGLILLSNSCSKDDTILADGEDSFDPTDLTAREAAQELYDTYYVTSSTVSGDVAWSGNSSSCTAGGVPQATMEKVFKRIEYFRKAVGLSNTIAENSTKSEKAQAAALMMKSNGKLDHFPPESWNCYSTSGKEGAGNSLLTQTRNAEAVDSYIRDAGQANGPVGHRRWLLWPRLQEIGVGNTDATNAIWVLGNSGTPPEDAPEFISWPPEGYLPKQFAYPRWSFSIRNADFTGASITMQNQENQSISLTVETLDNAYGDRTIVWVPAIDLGSLENDASFKVTIKDIGIGEETKDFEYAVILFETTE